jgi:hypothetical protein
MLKYFTKFLSAVKIIVKLVNETRSKVNEELVKSQQIIEKMVFS